MARENEGETLSCKHVTWFVAVRVKGLWGPIVIMIGHNDLE